MRKLIAVLFSAACLWAAMLACFSSSTPRPSLEFRPAQMPDAQTGIPYAQQILISQNVTPVYTIYLADGTLPDGLKLEYVEKNDYARIVGTPTAVGAFKFVVRVLCLGTSINGQTGEMEYTIVVK